MFPINILPRGGEKYHDIKDLFLRTLLTLKEKHFYIKCFDAVQRNSTESFLKYE